MMKNSIVILLWVKIGILYQEKKDATQSTLEMLEQKKKTEMNPLLHLFYLKRIRTLWIYLKRPFAVVVIIVIIWRMI